MKKSVVKSDKVLLKLVLRALGSAVLLLLVFDLAASEIIFKLNLSLESAALASVGVCALTAFGVSLITTLGLKNHAIVIGLLSVLPLVFYSLVNLIFGGTSAVLFFIKLALMLLCGALGGVLTSRKAKRFKV